MRFSEAPGEFLEKPHDLEVKEKDMAIFVAKISKPNAKVSWHRDGEPIKESEQHQCVEDGNFRKLIITSSTVNDEGEYTCVLGDQECTVELVVIGE